MRKILAVAFALAVFGVAGVVEAAPSLFVNSLTGNLRVTNDVAGGIMNIKSAAGTLNTPTWPLGAPAAPAVVDLGDLPTFIALLNTPTGTYKLGDGTRTKGANDTETIIKADITFDWYTAFGQPVNVGEVTVGVPEPATIAMAGLGMVGMVAAARRRRA